MLQVINVDMMVPIGHNERDDKYLV